MPNINLTVRGKQAMGDGTKIVCMNKDYVVRITCKDCETFEQAPVKKLIVKCGHEYRESPIEIVEENGQTFGQAVLPMISRQSIVELGICGKESDDAYSEPLYTSNSAKYECVKSILCGAAVLKEDPTLISLEVKSNGKYNAYEYNADGFYEVHAEIPEAAVEQRTVGLSMALGNQVIEPSTATRNMSKVTVTRPVTMLPENIKKGVDIGGIVGTYDKTLIETEVYYDGEYTPPAGVDGFSKVKVSVGSSNYARIMRLGDSFKYDYDHSINITVDTPGIVKYENDGDVIIVTAIAKGNCALLIKDLNAQGEVVNTVHYAIIVDTEADYLCPVEAENIEQMNVYLSAGVEGAVIKYTGSSGNGFVRNALYIIEEEN